MAKPKFYVVWEGRKPGIYQSWAECLEQVDRFPNAKYKSFVNEVLAKEAYQMGWQKFTESVQPLSLPAEVVAESVSVDAACDGSPGNVEYRGVDTQTGEELFHVGPIENGTNNLGEFLAIVHALALLKKKSKSIPVYSDSRSALSWVKKKEVRSTLPKNEQTEKVWRMVRRALTWLEKNTYPNELIEWNSEDWGEIRADFGRK